MFSNKKASPPSAGKGACDPLNKTTDKCPEECWKKDCEKKISATSYARYFRKYKKDGTEYTVGELPVLKFIGKILAPVKTGSKITVEVRFSAVAQVGKDGKPLVTAADITEAKKKLDDGVATYWNGKFTLEADDPVCGKKSFGVEYKVIWVTSGQDFSVIVYDTYDREGVNGGSASMFVSKTTSAWTYSHEFGHCIGLPDEYSYKKPDTESVKHIAPDGKLNAGVTAPFNGKSGTAADATLMAAVDCTTLTKNHCWNVAIEVQELLTAELGRKIKCNII